MPIQDQELQRIVDQLKYAKKCNDPERVERLLQERAEYKRKRRNGGATAPDKRPKTSAETTTTESANQVSRSLIVSSLPPHVVSELGPVNMCWGEQNDELSHLRSRRTQG